MRAFEFLEPTSVAEASAMLREQGESARAIAGGTSLVLMLRHRLVAFSHLVNLGALRELSQINVAQDGALHIGALATHAEVAADPDVVARLPVLAEMAQQVANPQIRNVATLGGNLCYGDPASDPPTCLIALGARACVQRGREEREIPLDGFFTGYYENVLENDDIVTKVVVPPLPANGIALFSRFITSQAEGRPLVVAALRFVRTDRNVWSDVRLVIGAVVSAPIRISDAEAHLTGRPLDRTVLSETAEIAARSFDPGEDFRATADYRREVASVIVRRLLECALEAR